ncbi:response regulator [Sulfurospirillum barnesii]|uniref:Response regulator with CheY-like receiver, AAA-type ATPase, and DNA-binding domains n=1 Tax=Sulfurospirillum barnesii (strain ATCC 700032 / DSM 10660 / SES-3) TaxID=760154 RepID=I3XZR9_SULBS|nr:response regulator [Sulfurospirillum barnesii]AFL69443.1 response regulator with CheY-like receiver, AAA-type ATPase, and DNA-binding domains [Sulfurospirillum barnesii SES-3]
MNKIIKVAIIDDEQEILNMIEKSLNRTAGFAVTTFSNPLNAISHIDKTYDVVLLDIMMPQMNGLDVLKRLHEKTPGLKIIMMTAYSTLDKVLKSHREGATHYVMKPFSSMKALEEKIYELVL